MIGPEEPCTQTFSDFLQTHELFPTHFTASGFNSMAVEIHILKDKAISESVIVTLLKERKAISWNIFFIIPGNLTSHGVSSSVPEITLYLTI